MSLLKNTPERLLVIDIPGGEGWEKLCPFPGLVKSRMRLFLLKIKDIKSPVMKLAILAKAYLHDPTAPINGTAVQLS